MVSDLAPAVAELAEKVREAFAKKVVFAPLEVAEIFEDIGKLYDLMTPDDQRQSFSFVLGYAWLLHNTVNTLNARKVSSAVSSPELVRSSLAN